MNDIEIIENSIKVLSSVSLPMVLHETAGAQINAVLKNLIMLYQAIKENAKHEQEANAKAEEPGE